MKPTLKELWYGNIDPCEKCGANDTELRNLLRLVERHRGELAEGMGKEQQAVLEKMMECSNEYTSVNMERAFCDGFCLAAKLMAEALSLNNRE